jgi:hypothetical protein
MPDVAIDKSLTDAGALHRDAYNAAFYELGLHWHWDTEIYAALSPDADGGSNRIRAYLEKQHAHLLKVYDPAFLIGAIQETKAHCFESMSACDHRVVPDRNWEEIQRDQIGI